MSPKLGPLVVILVALTSADSAFASEVQFGPNDVATVFFISKSDDHNRVDYGIHLTAQCAPASDEALFPYWREFERPPVRTHGLGMLEWVPFGFAEQRTIRRTPSSGVQHARLKQFDRPIEITTSRDVNGRCVAVAHARINGIEGAELVSVFAQKSGAMSVDHIDVHGKDPSTGADIVERIRK